jgi:hypothetical protein
MKCGDNFETIMREFLLCRFDVGYMRYENQLKDRLKIILRDSELFFFPDASLYGTGNKVIDSLLSMNRIKKNGNYFKLLCGWQNDFFGETAQKRYTFLVKSWKNYNDAISSNSSDQLITHFRKQYLSIVDVFSNWIYLSMKKNKNLCY